MSNKINEDAMSFRSMSHHTYRNISRGAQFLWFVEFFQISPKLAVATNLAVQLPFLKKLAYSKVRKEFDKSEFILLGFRI
jgi:hypothetical protein